jgi:hypothetical protein
MILESPDYGSHHVPFDGSLGLVSLGRSYWTAKQRTAKLLYHTTERPIQQP